MLGAEAKHDASTMSGPLGNPPYRCSVKPVALLDQAGSPGHSAVMHDPSSPVVPPSLAAVVPVDPLVSSPPEVVPPLLPMEPPLASEPPLPLEGLPLEPALVPMEPVPFESWPVLAPTSTCDPQPD